MELRQLEYFVAVADEASFTRAAAKLHVAQPGVSAQIRQLERELGQALFDRSARTVTLTDAGRTVLPYARAALAAVAGAKGAVDDLVGLVRGRISVGMIASCTVFDLPELLAEFHHVHPEVEITLSEASANQLAEQLRDGRLDVALIALGPGPIEGLATLPVADEVLVAAVRRDDPMSGAMSMPLDELRHRPLIALPKGAGVRAVIDAACASRGFRPHIAFEASDPRVLAQMAARGLGTALIPRSVAKLADDLVALPLGEPEMTGRVVLAWRVEGPLGPAAAAFIRYAQTSLDPSHVIDAERGGATSAAPAATPG